jgi:prevent-host-death family protein
MDDRTQHPKATGWPLQDAKNRFSEVVRRARSDGPQTVTVHGRRAAVALSAEDYDALANARTKRDLVDLLLEAPFDEEFAALLDDRSTFAPEKESEF